MEDKLDSLIKAVNDLKTSNNKLVSSINSLFDKVASITNKINGHSAQLNTLSSELASLTTKVETLEANIASSNTKSSILIYDNLISEMIDRQSRRNNVLLFNLPDDSTNASSDSTSIQNILHFLNLKSKPNSVIRLGKPSSSNTTKPRPQQEYMSHLRQELLNRQSNGEQDLIIRTTSKALQKLSIQKTNFHSQYIQLLLPKSFTETWLHNNVSSLELGLVNYEIYRYDRSLLSSSSTRGGGVLIAVNKKCISSQIDVDIKSLELCFVSVKINNLISSRPNNDLLLFGDFNLPNLNKASLNANLNLSSPEAIFLENLSFLNLFQINTIFNSYGSILDLILSNCNSQSISLNKDSIVPVDNYHLPINVSYSQFYTPSPLSFSEETYDWYKGDYINILSFLGSINWNEFFNISNDITTITKEFYSLLLYAIDTFIPKKRYCKSKFPCWFSKDLINLIKLKKFQHSIFKLSNSHDDYQQFSSTRAQCKSLSRFDYAQYLAYAPPEFAIASSPIAATTTARRLTFSRPRVNKQ
ncbi:Endonuclease/exonuclease/phosphatase [Cinara cedri]|uniref:Endonuclease/exonuclease/phosphatase n=1 Tax=Cinara cedri TaxID=506608 RepID=A0A5E4MR91_9HEMI|nr:Endonuclease/exonuclease/phosphatase [Cinara cedri]